MIWNAPPLARESTRQIWSLEEVLTKFLIVVWQAQTFCLVSSIGLQLAST